MAILTKGTTFDNGDQVTAAKLNALVDSAAFVSGSGGTTDNTTLEVSGGVLAVKDSGISSNKIASNAVTTIKITDANVTTAKIADLNVTTGKIADLGVTTAKIADLNVTTGKIADAAITTAKLAQPLTVGTAQNSTSGTSINFTSIPSWVKRITVLFNEVSTNGSSAILVQAGSGSILTSGYISTGNRVNNASGTSGASSTTGFYIHSDGAANTLTGSMVIALVGSNVWISNHTCKVTTTNCALGGGTVTLSGALDRLRITTGNGTDTFDAGQINIMYE